jgi:hypothetical protein
VDDAAIAGEQPAMRRGDDVAGGSDAILQRHLVAQSVSHIRHCEEPLRRSNPAYSFSLQQETWIASLRSQ